MICQDALSIKEQNRWPNDSDSFREVGCRVVAVEN